MAYNKRKDSVFEAIVVEAFAADTPDPSVRSLVPLGWKLHYLILILVRL